MKKIDISAYDVEIAITGPDGARIKKKVPYQVRDSIIGILFSQQGLKARALLDRDDLARKVRDCVGDHLFLEDAEYDKLAKAVELLEGFTQNDVTLVRRLLTPETVDVNTVAQ